MDRNDVRETWITGDYVGDLRNDFVTKSSMDERYTEYRKCCSKDSPIPVKSRADIMLAEIEKELEATETRYDSAKERLRYSQLLYHTAGSVSLDITNDYDKTDESPITQRNSQSPIFSNSRLMDERNSDNNLLASGDTQYLKEAKNTRQQAQDDSEPIEQSPVYTTRSFKLTPLESKIFHDVHDDNSHDSDTQRYFSERPRGGKLNFFYKDARENCVLHENHIDEELVMNDMSARKPHPYQLNLAEYSKGLQDELEEESRHPESPTIEDRVIHTDRLKSASREQESTKADLHLNPSVLPSTESLQSPMKNKKSRTDKQRRVSSKIVSKPIDDTIGVITKRKRKKRGIKTSNSRCTTATRDTGISENKKDIKKRRQRAHSTISGLQSSQDRRHDTTKVQINTNEVVEIYHNSAAKSGSISVVSSKHSNKLMESRGSRGLNITNNKLHQPSRINGSYELMVNDDRGKSIPYEHEEKRSRKQQNYQRNPSPEKRKNGDESYQDNMQDFTDLRSGERNGTNCRVESLAEQSENKVIQEYISRDHRHHQRHNCRSPDNSSPHDDNLLTRNYELPTVASRLKQVNRSYFNRFNFRNIPFVVGTSVTPSYNVGLNVQEMLSLMKTRQITMGGVSPLLISKVTKGIIPVSALLGCIRDEDETLAEESNIPWDVNSPRNSNTYPEQTLNVATISRSVQLEPFFVNKTSKLSCIRDTDTIYEADQSCANPKIELTSKKQKIRSFSSSAKFNGRKSIESQPELTPSALLKQRQEEIQIRDSQSMKLQDVTHSTKGIHEVFKNFHDQYEIMILKHDSLQEKAKKTNDESLEKEIECLEHELNAKEAEIKAVAGLYQEVMILKQQMKMLHEKNNLVCVATESPGRPMYPNLSIRAQTANPIRAINFYRQAVFVNNQGRPTPTKLAGVLRQVKTFQKQLKSTP